MQTFPTIESVYKFFSPKNWGYAAEHERECLTYPCITLRQVDEAYNTPGAAQNIVRGQLVGVYSMTTAREPYNTPSANLAADMFISKYGHECTLYNLLLYFANYLMEYKSTYAQFDVEDILIQFGRKFIPRKRLRTEPEQGQPTSNEQAISLEELTLIWVREGRTDEDIRQGGLYQTGMITDEMIRDARDECGEENVETPF